MNPQSSLPLLYPQSTYRGKVEIGGVYLPSQYAMVDIVKEVDGGMEGTTVTLPLFLLYPSMYSLWI